MNILTTTLIISAVVVFLAVASDVIADYISKRKLERKVAQLREEHRSKWALHVHIPVARPHGTHRKAGA